MSRREIKNPAASVRTRLLNKAKTEGQAFHQILQRYAMERFLYRLSVSDYADSFYLKGALLFWVWNVEERRTTMDIDLLGFTDNSPETVSQVLGEVCRLDMPDDGLRFDMDSLRVQRIKEEADYEGVRASFRMELDTAVITMQVDIGFGDRIESAPGKKEFPVLLDMPVPQLRCYSLETMIAEKFEAMVKLELLNSRMKDFYDIWLLMRQFPFEMKALSAACRATFKQRKTACSLESPLFGPEMKASAAKQMQWTAFCRKSKLTSCPESFSGLLVELLDFLSPVAQAMEVKASVSGHWKPGGPWLLTDP